MKIVKILLASIMILSLPSLTNAADAAKKTVVLAEVNGTVEMKPATPKAVWVAGVANTSLAKGDLVRTGKDSSAIIHINENPETVSVELKGQSELEIVSLISDAKTGEKSTLLSLGVGEAMVRAKNMGAGSKFEIKTPTSVVASQGINSSFSVQVERSE